MLPQSCIFAVLKSSIAIITVCINYVQATDAIKFGAEILGSIPPESGVYEIGDVCGGKIHTFHANYLTQNALCDGKNDGGGWTVILRRKSNVTPKVNFTRTWNDYVHGFGDLNTEFWYGLRNIHCLTSRQSVDLKLVLSFTNGTTYLWTYRYFVVDRPEDKYMLNVGQAEGPSAFDTLAYNNGSPFYTYDNDNSGNCAKNREGGGWWYKSCNYCELTRPRPRIYNELYLDFVEMKVRPKLTSIL